MHPLHYFVLHPSSSSNERNSVIIRKEACCVVSIAGAIPNPPIIDKRRMVSEDIQETDGIKKREAMHYEEHRLPRKHQTHPVRVTWYPVRTNTSKKTCFCTHTDNLILSLSLSFSLLFK